MHPSRKGLIIWGAAGHAKVLRECLPPEFELMAVFDNSPTASSPFANTPLYVGTDGFYRWLGRGDARQTSFLLAIGGDKGRDRLALHVMLEQQGLIPLSVVHPAAFVANSARIGAGCQVLAGASVCVDVALGIQTIVNTNASVDHECVIGAGVHIAPGATLAGCVEVGEGAMVGVGAVVLPHLKVGADAIVGAGAVVVKNVPDNVIVYGNPARVIRTRGS